MTSALITVVLAASAPATDVFLDTSRARWERLAMQLWEFAETALQETQSATLTAELLEKEGFRVTRNIGGMDTAFVASAGSGHPVVALLAEYDALPALSQHAGVARQKPRVDGAPGHGCAHNLLGGAAVAAAVAANKARLAQKLPGTIQVFGTPAEEIGIGKTFMLMAGAFKDTEAVLAWHPNDKNEVAVEGRLAVTLADVEFFGKTAHAGIAPWLGRSSLDALEVFEHAMALMREHIYPTARIHRVIKDGGKAANIIPDYSKVQVWLRDKSIESVEEMLGRMRKAADGAALATETRAKVTVLTSVRNPVDNSALGSVLQKHLERIGPPRFEERDQLFAKAIQKEVGAMPTGMASEIAPYGPGHGTHASSDLGEVSAMVPLAEVTLATRPLGTAAHHWATTASAAHPVGFQGMHVAAKVLSASVVELLTDPAVVAQAKEEFAKATLGKSYVSPLPQDAKPRVF
jgi:aminobenzoyl-glutamate utilization protein B